jgi:uncharacterized membrane protein (UPF0127 family)
MGIKQDHPLPEYVRYGAIAVVVVALATGGFLVWQSYRTSPARAAAVSSSTNFITGSFGGISMQLELAESVTAQEKGLGGRTNVPDGYGMLFVFPVAGDYGFWMKDMEVPIDMFWLDDNGHVITIKENVSPDSYPDVFYPTSDARYVLETKAGFASEHGIVIGSMLTGLPASESVL